MEIELKLSGEPGALKAAFASAAIRSGSQALARPFGRRAVVAVAMEKTPFVIRRITNNLPLEPAQAAIAGCRSMMGL